VKVRGQPQHLAKARPGQHRPYGCDQDQPGGGNRHPHRCQDRPQAKGQPDVTDLSDLHGLPADPAGDDP